MNSLAFRVGRVVAATCVAAGLGLAMVNTYDYLFGEPGYWQEGDFLAVLIRCAAVIVFGVLVYLVTTTLRRRR